MTVAPEVQAIVRPSWWTAPVQVRDRSSELDDRLRDAAARLRQQPEAPDVTAAVRTMYRRVGLDPTRTRPSSEALLRRVRRGDPLPRINTAVDVINWCSVETQLPFGLYDHDRTRGSIVLRLGRDGEEYPGIRKDVVHVVGRLTLADEDGPFGNPTSDSARTMVTVATRHVLVVIFTPAMLPAAVGDAALEVTRARLATYCAAGT